MGMDIHAFIEYETGLGSASSFAKVNISRNYQLFKVLDSFPIRGLPDNLGSAVQREFFVPVIDPEKEASWAGCEYVTRIKAEEWIANDESFYLKNEHLVNGYVSKDGWEKPSWLTLAELENALEQYTEFGDRSMGFDFLVVLDTMRSIEKHIGKGSTRLVFWYDV